MPERFDSIFSVYSKRTNALTKLQVACVYEKSRSRSGRKREVLEKVESQDVVEIQGKQGYFSAELG